MKELRVVQINRARSPEGRAFLKVPFELYARVPQWIPWLHADLRLLLDRRHPFFDHSDGAFFLARRDGRAAGRIAVFENRRYNESHGVAHAQFYFFDVSDDAEASHALLEAAEEWARSRSLTSLTGPLGIGATSGGGILIDGFDHRAAMTMMSYNFPYYRKLLEAEGYSKYLDLYSYFLDARTFRLTDRIRNVAQIALKRGSFDVMLFRTKRELKRSASEIAAVYNTALGDHPESYSLSPGEIARVTADLMLVADPSLMKVLRYKGRVAGFLFGFPDLSAALQRAHGRLNPLTILGILLERRRTRSLIINGAGILPEYQRLGGNALLYYELERTVQAGGRFLAVDLCQIAETTTLMLRDIETIGATRYKTHRIYSKVIR